jgi:hypothetical protein
MVIMDHSLLEWPGIARVRIELQTVVEVVVPVLNDLLNSWPDNANLDKAVYYYGLSNRNTVRNSHGLI